MSDNSWQITSALSPVSPEARSIRVLIIGVIVMAVFISLLVTGLVAWTLLRYRDRDGKTPVQSEGNRKMEVIYTVIPLGIMVALFICTVITMGRAEPATNKPPDLVIVAHQWWWEIRYPHAGVVTANEIHLPAGVPMVSELRSADVIHELWVPQLAPKLDAVPGQHNHLVLQADTPGIYLGACAEFCGAQHAHMRLRVIVQLPEDFAKWEEQQSQAPAAVTGASAQGRTLFLSESCVQCHTIQGTDADGDTGPNLTHVASRATLASCTLDNTPQNLHLWLANPQAIKPGCHMPNMKLNDQQLQHLVSYLETLK